MSCRCKKNRINKYVDVSHIRPREWNEAESILGLSHCGDIMAYDKPEFEMTEDDRDKLDQVTIDGEGDKALYDDGEYKPTYTAEQVDTTLEEYYTKEEIDTTLEEYYTKEDIAEVLEDAVFYEDDQINTRSNINLAENSKITGKQTGVNGNQQFDMLETSEFGTIHVGSPLVSLNVRSNKRPTAQVTTLNETANEQFAYLSDIDSLGEDLGGDLEDIKEGLQKQINDLDEKVDGHIADYDAFKENVGEKFGNVDADLADIREDVAENTANIATNTSDIEGLRNDFNASSKFKGYFEENNDILDLEGEEGAYAWSAESGTVWVYDNDLKTWKNSGVKIPDQTVVAYNGTPLMDGEADAGTAVEYARGDHRHPTDESRAAKTDLDDYLALAGNTETTQMTGDIWLGIGNKVRLNESGNSSLSQDINTQTTILEGNGGGGIELNTELSTVRYNGKEVAVTEQVEQVSDRVKKLGKQVVQNATHIATNTSDIETLRNDFNASSKFKGYFETSDEIMALEGEEGAYAWSAQSGKVWMYDNELKTWKETDQNIPDQTVEAYDGDPYVDGEAHPGTANKYARGDHRHPTDESRAAVTDLDNYLALAGNTEDTAISGDVWMENGNSLRLSETEDVFLKHDLTTQTTIISGDGIGGIDLQAKNGEVKYNGDEVATVKQVEKVEADLEATRDDLQTKLDATNEKVADNKATIEANKGEFDGLLDRFDIAPKFVGYFETNNEVTDQPAEKGAFAWSAETGTVWEYDSEDATWKDSGLAIPDQTVNGSNVDPLMDGIAKAGGSDDYSRADHVHPTDTSRAAVTDLDHYLALAGNTQDTKIEGDVFFQAGKKVFLSETIDASLSQKISTQTTILENEGTGGIDLKAANGSVKYNGEEIATVNNVSAVKNELQATCDAIENSLEDTRNDLQTKLDATNEKVADNKATIEANKGEFDALLDRFDIAPKFVGYFETNNEVTDQPAEKGAFAWSAETGTVWEYDSEDATWKDSGLAIPDQTVNGSDIDPLMDGIAKAGGSDDYSRADHVHPTDTTRAAVTDLDNYLALAGNTATSQMTGDIWLGIGNKVHLNESGKSYISQDSDEQAVVLHSNGGGGINLETDFGAVKYNGKEVAIVEDVEALEEKLENDLSDLQGEVSALKDSTEERFENVNEEISDINTQVTENKANIGVNTSDIKSLSDRFNFSAKFKGYFKTIEEIEALEGEDGTYAWCAATGSVWMYDTGNNVWYNSGKEVPDQTVEASDSMPLMDKEAEAGTSNQYARGDHRHPTDESRASKAELADYFPLAGNSEANKITGDICMTTGKSLKLNNSGDAYIQLEENSQALFISTKGANGIDLKSEIGAVKYNGKEIATKEYVDSKVDSVEGTLTQDISEIKSDIEDLETSLNARIDAVGTSASDAHDKIASLEESVEENFKTVNEKAAGLEDSLNREISARETDVETLTSSFNSVDAKVETLKEAVADDIERVDKNFDNYLSLAGNTEATKMTGDIVFQAGKGVQLSETVEAYLSHEGTPQTTVLANDGAGGIDFRAGVVTYNSKEIATLDDFDFPSTGDFNDAVEEINNEIAGLDTSIKAVDTKVDDLSVSVDSRFVDVNGKITKNETNIIQNSSNIESLSTAFNASKKFKGYYQTVAEITALEGEEGAYAWCADTGKVWTYDEAIPTWKETGQKIPDQTVAPFEGLPLMDGTTAEKGTANEYARGDHRHPTDESRAAKTDLNKVQSDVTVIQSDITSLKTSVQDAEERIGELETAVENGFKDVNEEVSALQESLNEEISERKEDIKTVTSRVGNVETEVKTLSGKVTSEVQRIDNNFDNYLKIAGGNVTGDLTVKGTPVVVNGVNAPELKLHSDSVQLTSTHASVSSLHLLEGKVTLTGTDIELKTNSGTVSYNGKEVAVKEDIPTDYAKDADLTNVVKRIDKDIENLQEEVHALDKKVSDDVIAIRKDISDNKISADLTASNLESLEKSFNASSKFKGYFETTSEVQTLPAEEGAYAWCAETGTVWMYINTAWSNSGKKIPDQTVDAHDGLPLMDGVANAGSVNKYARGDHRHPSDSSKQDKLVDGVSIKTLNGQPILGAGNIVINQDNIVNLVQLTGSDSTAIMSQLAVTNAINTVDNKFANYLPTTGGNLSGELKVKNDTVVVNGTNATNLKLSSGIIELSATSASPSSLNLNEGNVELTGNKTVKVTSTGGSIELNSYPGTVNYNGKEVATVEQMTTVIDNLNSTSASDALSANQGRVLKAEIDALKALISSITPVAVQESTPTSAGVITLSETPKDIVMVSYGRLALFNSDYTTNGSTLTITNSDIAISATDKVKVIYTKSL